MTATARQRHGPVATARAILLDRDGTLVEARHFPTRPEELVLSVGLKQELLALQESGFQFVVATNQSGLARGLFDEAALDAMHDHLRGLLGACGIALAGIYHCPHHPEGSVTHLAIDCDCRKPAPGLLLRAAADLGLDLGRSWFVGDILDDCEAGNRAGCRTILVDRGTESIPTSPSRHPTFVARSTAHSLRIIRAVEGLGPPVELDYRPPGW
jgi:D-glycero-D-manno-heptose 1,7-bisphosphate phosphatase